MVLRLRLLAILGALAILVIGGARLRGPGAIATSPTAAAASAAASPGQPLPTEPLTVGVSDVHPSVTPDGSTVLSVRLVADVRATADIDWSTIRFVLTAPGSTGTEGRATATPSPSLPTVGDAAFGLTFDLRGLSAAPAPDDLALAGGAPPAPGAWLLTVEVRDIAGDVERASTAVMVVAEA